MNKMFAVATVLASLAVATSANAQSADAGAGAKIIAPLEISNVTDLYFGTIAPSTTVADTVVVMAQGQIEQAEFHRVVIACGRQVDPSRGDASPAQQRPSKSANKG